MMDTMMRQFEVILSSIEGELSCFEKKLFLYEDMVKLL